MVISRRRWVALVFVALLAATMTMVYSSGAPARADSSCRSLVAAQVARLGLTQRYADPIQLTIHNQGDSWVSYSSGYVYASLPRGTLRGSALQYFSDRTVNRTTQRFNKDAAEMQDLTISPTGVLTINNRTRRFTTTVDMTCPGPLMTKYASKAQYTLSFGRVFMIPT